MLRINGIAETKSRALSRTRDGVVTASDEIFGDDSVVRSSLKSLHVLCEYVRYCKSVILCYAPKIHWTMRHTQVVGASLKTSPL